MSQEYTNRHTCKLFFLSLFFGAFLFSFTFSLRAAEILNDSAKISLLTASPWDGAVYALYGHTAIRVKDDSTGVDAVFNYGYFDSSQPGFIYNFVRGKTDYILGVTSFTDFLNEYSDRGQQVVEQQLNLSPSEKQLLYNALEKNALPENREYRYNYFLIIVLHAHVRIESFVIGEIEYSSSKIINHIVICYEALRNYPWYNLGVDLPIGSKRSYY